MDLGLVADATGVDRVRQQVVDVATRKCVANGFVTLTWANQEDHKQPEFKLQRFDAIRPRLWRASDGELVGRLGDVGR